MKDFIFLLNCGIMCILYIMLELLKFLFADERKPGLMMTMSMLKQASSKSWLSSKLWLLEFEIVVRRKGCEKFE